jgi:hypothetical protein
MKYRDKLIDYFNSLPVGYVVAANELYERHFSKMSEGAFFKALERLVKDGTLTRISKGMYTLETEVAATMESSAPVQKIARIDAYEQAVSYEQAISFEHSEGDESMLNYYFGENNDNGMYIGSRLYYKFGLTDILSEDIELYSNAITKETSNVGHIHVKRINIELTYENTRVIEALEILQNYEKIENLNKVKFAKYAKAFARGYQDEAAVYVLTNIKYKKNTIAFMKKILDMYNKVNSLQKFLSYASRYKVPPVQRVAR